MKEYWEAHKEWSEKTFGLGGPKGSIEHLKLEVEEVLENPQDIIEFADCQMLLYDAVRRAGFTYEEFWDACWKKLEICKKRKWKKSNPGEPTLHEKE